jgi:hypothetical protein
MHDYDDMTFHPKEMCRCHGNFSALNISVLYGMGQPVPANVDGSIHAPKLYCLIGDQNIQCLATFASGKSLHC